MRTLTVATILIAATGLTGCTAGGLFGRNSPDEYSVARQAPLVVPPDYSLVPPQPGAPSSVDTSQQEALGALFGGPAPRSDAESNLIGRAGEGRSDAGIRSNVAAAENITVAKGALTQAIVAAPEGAGQEATAAIPGV